MRLILLFLLALTVAVAAPIQRDLGQGLVYFRVHALPADLPAGDGAAKHACVLDLRYAQGDQQAAAALGAWLRFHAGAHTPIVVLANADTASPILAAIMSLDHVPGVLRVGIATDAFHPDITVTESAGDERRAYDAFENGTALTALLSDHPDKVRNDEASLAKDRPIEAPPDSADAPKTSPASPPIDAVLQRAVHLHRALVALRKV